MYMWDYEVAAGVALYVNVNLQTRYNRHTIANYKETFCDKYLYH